MSFHPKGNVGRAAPAARDDSHSLPNDVRVADAKRLHRLLFTIIGSLVANHPLSPKESEQIVDELVEVIERYNNYRG